MERHLRILGTYVAAAAAAQLSIYTLFRYGGDRFDHLFYFDTRIALFFAEAVVIGSRNVSPPAFIAWFSELGFLVIGIAMLLGKRPIRTYLVLEGILFLPFLLFVPLIAAAGMSAEHGFSFQELYFPSLAVVICCLVPFGYAVWIFRKMREQSSAA